MRELKRYLAAGRLGSPRGLKGEVKFDCWCDSPEFLEGIDKLYLDADGTRELKVLVFRVSIPSIIFEGYQDRGTASALTNRTVYFDRNDVKLAEGICFNDDLIGLDVFETVGGQKIGVLTRIDEGISSNYYYICGESTDYYIPQAGDYIEKIDIENGIYINSYEGLEIRREDK